MNSIYSVGMVCCGIINGVVKGFGSDYWLLFYPIEDTASMTKF